jgi:hypothetical protein
MRIFRRLPHENWYFSCLRCSHSEVHPKKRKKSIINSKWRTISLLYSRLTECLHPAPPLYRIRVGFYSQLDAKDEVINPKSIYDVIRFFEKVNKNINKNINYSVTQKKIWQLFYQISKSTFC